MTLPSHATDCHVHVYDPARFAAPSPVPTATWSDYARVQRQLGLQRAVLVQPVGYGFDNACLLDALVQAGQAARGIAVIKAETRWSELSRLHQQGVRGVRFMMVPGAGGVLPWDALERISWRIAELGWVINLQLDGRDLPDYQERLLALPSRLSIDHVGKFLEPVPVGHAAFKTLLRLLDGGNTWVKLSAPYETSRIGAPLYEDVGVLAQTLINSHPERCLWASNWPHPGRDPRPSDSAMLDLLSHWATDGTWRRRILADNPAVLYGFDD
ncbi:2-pyrone-4,6-dicarboxylate hydrolase [Pseudomonas chlororaphis subsp. aurantiaca]|nr:2-pyrone-4,6-dicarboxylate hydrolase [Pseudomonas chlororaphis subsp. aurantiaca]